MDWTGIITMVCVFGFLSLAVWVDYRKDALKIKSGRSNLWDKWFGVGTITGSDEGLGGAEPAMHQELQQLREQNQKLAERVEVLERIVTDSGFELDQQIRKL
ncbi:hypothetical protein [uncultured Ferrimonas sp.]|uniref:hypothetical protein n=1 Tax=uncultured Ferrimonas sp. TaxID=432640 RepID=UPI00260DBF00|nr:hypothetical protein [uncultured Ferrimonas sp.]